MCYFNTICDFAKKKIPVLIEVQNREIYVVEKNNYLHNTFFS